MKPNEFKSWWSSHRAVFPEMNTWLGKVPREDQQGTVLAWQRAMEDISLEDAEAATQAMLRGDIKKPFQCSDHPAAIIGYARQLRNNRVGHSEPIRRWHDGEETYRCPICRDDGLLSVWHEESMFASVGRGGLLSRLGKAPRPSAMLVTMTVVCTCQAGDAYEQSHVMRYNERIHMIPDRRASAAEELDRLREFTEALLKPKPHAEFANFS